VGSSYRKSSIYCLEKLKSRKLLKTPEQWLNELLIRATITWSIGGRDDQRVKRHPETARIAAISHGTTSTPGPPQNRRQVGRFTLYSHITHTHTHTRYTHGLYKCQYSFSWESGFKDHCPVFSQTNQGVHTIAMQ